MLSFRSRDVELFIELKDKQNRKAEMERDCDFDIKMFVENVCTATTVDTV